MAAVSNWLCGETYNEKSVLYEAVAAHEETFRSLPRLFFVITNRNDAIDYTSDFYFSFFQCSNVRFLELVVVLCEIRFRFGFWRSVALNRMVTSDSPSWALPGVFLTENGDTQRAPSEI